MKLRNAIAAMLLSIFGLSQAQAQFKPAIDAPPNFTPPPQGTPSQFPPIRVPEPPRGWATGQVFKGSWSEQTELKRMRALLVVDTNSNLTDHTRKSLATMRGMLCNGIPADRLDLTILQGDDATPDKVLDYYRNLNTNADEVVLFYYAGHGAMDKSKRFTDGSQGHYLAMTAGNLLRSDVVKSIKAKKPGLTVLLTDCCSADVGGADTRLPEAESSDARVPEAVNPRQLSPLCRNLFFQHRGVVDYTAALPGTFGYADRVVGLWFTATMDRMFAAPQNSFPNGGRDLSWEAFDSVIIHRVGDFLKERQSTVVFCPYRFIHN